MPPEADREADVEGADKVPALGRDVEQLAGVEGGLRADCLRKEGEAGQVRALNIHLQQQATIFNHRLCKSTSQGDQHGAISAS